MSDEDLPRGPIFCAWCMRKKVGPAEWIEAPPPRVPVSHGICPRCAASANAALRAVRETFICVRCGLRLEGRENRVTGEVFAYDRATSQTPNGSERRVMCSGCREA